jgi:hypothetical protein
VSFPAVVPAPAGPGFEQHGFLNLMLATDAALCGAAPTEVTRVVAERDPEAVAGAVTELSDAR